MFDRFVSHEDMTLDECRAQNAIVFRVSKGGETKTFAIPKANEDKCSSVFPGLRVADLDGVTINLDAEQEQGFIARPSLRYFKKRRKQ